MRYWVYGVDGVSREPREPLFLEAANEEDARAQAKARGMAVAEVEAVEPKAVSSPAPTGTAQPADSGRTDADHPVAAVLVKVFRVLAGVVALLYLILLFLTLDAALKAEELARKMGSSTAAPVGAAVLRILLEAVFAVAVLLAVAEFLRLGMAVERNTRGQVPVGERRKLR